MFIIKKIGIIIILIYYINCQSIDYPDFNPNNRYQQQQQQNLQNQQNPEYNQNRPNYQNPQTQNTNPFQPVVGAVNNTVQNAYGAVGRLINNTFGGGPGPVEMRSYVRLQLQGYLDQNFRLSQSTLCQCPAGPSGTDCMHKSPSRNGYACFFNFMVVVSSTSPDVLYDATPFVVVGSGAGNVNPDEMTNFRKQFEFNTGYKVKGITIIVNHNGAEIDASTGRVIQENSIINVDRFVIDLENNTQQYGQSVTTTLTGLKLGTQLQLSYTIGCRPNVFGMGCNLQCNRSSINQQYAVCQDIDTGYYSTCQWTPNNNNVQNCEYCPWGVRDGSYCVDEQGNVLESNQAGVVSSDFRTATIILGILCGCLLLCLIGAIIAVICARRRFNNANNGPAPGYNSRNTRGGHVGSAETQPLHSSNDRSTPAPHYIPKNKKPAPRLTVPAAYLGGDNPNDTLNTSFASQSPMNVSRSADV